METNKGKSMKPEMQLKERVNFEVCEKLNDISFNQFKELFECSSTKRHDSYDLRAEYTKLKNYTRIVCKTKNKHEVKYKYSKEKECGRLQAQNPSLQRIYNGFRGILSNGLTHDLDMDNCHPKILVNLCKKHKIKCPSLDGYIENREAYLADMMTEGNISRSEAKSLFLKCINKEDLTTKINNKKIKSKIFLDFDKETTMIMQSLYEIYKKEFSSKVEDKTYNLKGKTMNLVLQKYENEYLQKAIEYLTEQGIEVATLMYDGCMIYINNNYKIESIIKGLNKLFKKENMTWSVKPHNNELLKPLEEMKIIKIDSYIANDIIDLTNHILEEILNNRILRCNNIVYLVGENKIISNQVTIESELFSLFSRQDYNIAKKGKNGEEIIYSISREYQGLNNLVQSVIKLAPEDSLFLKQIWSDTRYKLFFNNGYYSFKENKFEKGGYNKTFVKIDRSFSETRSDKIKKDIYDKILNPIFSIDSENNKDDEHQIKLRDYFLYRMSRIMAGHIEDKEWVIMQGLRDSGKGMLTELLFNAFGNYVKTTNSDNFIYKKNTADASKALSWMIDYQFIRLAVAQELDIEQNWDGNKIKKFCSGGDEIEARKNFQDEMKFKIQSSLLVCCNDMPDIKPTDAKEFCSEFQMKSKFVKEPYDNNKKLKTFKYYRANSSLKAEYIHRPEVIHEFMWIILEAYNKECIYPQEIKIEQDEIEDEDDYSNLFELFKFTEEEEDFISNDELRQNLKQAGIPFTLKKAKMLLKTKGAKESRNAKGRGLGNIKIID